MSKKLRIGVIGTGGISRYHMHGWNKSRLGNLVAACDIQPDHLKGFCDEFGVSPDHAYADYRTMLRREELDAVSICTWAQHHADIVAAAARAGVRGVLCEKPLGYSIAESEKMRRAVEKAGTKVMVMHQRRYSTRFTQAARLIAKGAIGQPHTVLARGEGGLTNTHSHTVDMIRYILGDPQAEWVMAQVERSTNRWERCHPIEDCLVAVVAFAGGVQGIIQSDLPGVDGGMGLFAYGTEGTLDLFGGPRLMNRKTGGTWQLIERKEIDPPVCTCRDLARWLDGGTEPRIALRHALATHEILMGIYESARTRRRVTFPVKNRRRIMDQMIADGHLPLARKKAYDIRTQDAFEAGYR